MCHFGVQVLHIDLRDNHDKRTIVYHLRTLMDDGDVVYMLLLDDI